MTTYSVADWSDFLFETRWRAGELYPAITYPAASGSIDYTLNAILNQFAYTGHLPFWLSSSSTSMLDDLRRQFRTFTGCENPEQAKLRFPGFNELFYDNLWGNLIAYNKGCEPYGVQYFVTDAKKFWRRIAWSSADVALCTDSSYLALPVADHARIFYVDTIEGLDKRDGDFLYFPMIGISEEMRITLDDYIAVNVRFNDAKVRNLAERLGGMQEQIYSLEEGETCIGKVSRYKEGETEFVEIETQVHSMHTLPVRVRLAYSGSGFSHVEFFNYIYNHIDTDNNLSLPDIVKVGFWDTSLFMPLGSAHDPLNHVDNFGHLTKVVEELVAVPELDGKDRALASKMRGYQKQLREVPAEGRAAGLVQGAVAVYDFLIHLVEENIRHRHMPYSYAPFKYKGLERVFYEPRWLVYNLVCPTTPSYCRTFLSRDGSAALFMPHYHAGNDSVSSPVNEALLVSYDIQSSEKLLDFHMDFHQNLMRPDLGEDLDVSQHSPSVIGRYLNAYFGMVYPVLNFDPADFACFFGELFTSILETRAQGRGVSLEAAHYFVEPAAVQEIMNAVEAMYPPSAGEAFRRGIEEAAYTPEERRLRGNYRYIQEALSDKTQYYSYCLGRLDPGAANNAAFIGPAVGRAGVTLSLYADGRISASRFNPYESHWLIQDPAQLLKQ